MKTMQKKIFRQLIICLISSCCLYTLKAQTDQKITTIPIRDKFRGGSRNVFEEANYALRQHFQKTHPHIRIKFLPGMGFEGSVGDSFMFMTIASNNEGNRINIHLDWIQPFVQQGFIAPIDDLVFNSDPNIAFPEFKNLPEHLKERLSVNGKVYAIPRYYQPSSAILYRRDIFRSAGLNPDQPPTNWEDFYEAMKACCDPKTGRKGLVLTTDRLAGQYWRIFLYAAGGEMLREYKRCRACDQWNTKYVDTFTRKNLRSECTKCSSKIDQAAESKWSAVFDEEPGIKALEYFKKLRWEKFRKDGQTVQGVVKLATSRAELADIMVTGKAACQVGVTGHGDLLSMMARYGVGSDVFGVSGAIEGPYGKKVTVISCYVEAISAQCPPEQRLATWEWLRFTSGDEAKRITLKVMVENGFGKYCDPQDLRKFGYMDIYNSLDPYYVKASEEWKNHVYLPPPNQPEANILQKVDDAVDMILTNENADPRKVLKEAAFQCNSVLLKNRDPAQMKRYRILFSFVLLPMAGAVALGGWRIARGRIDTGQAKLQGTCRIAGTTKGYHIRAWMLMIPALASVLIWAYIPLIRGTQMAFFDWRILADKNFVGIDNFIEVFLSAHFWSAMLRSIYYVVLTLGLGFFAPVFTAILLDEVPVGKLFFRIIFYLPSVVAGLILMMFWKQIMFDPDPQGLLNQILAAIDGGLFAPLRSLNLTNYHLPPSAWLGSPKLAMICVILPGIWASAGPGSIIYLAALKSIPTELYEQGEIDGAGLIKKIRYITIPFLKPLLIINFVGALIGAFKASEGIFVMTGGGPGDATHVIGLEIFYQAFLYLKFGYATAMAWVLGSLLIGFTLFNLRILKQVQFKTAGRA